MDALVADEEVWGSAGESNHFRTVMAAI